jgi:hypothetical protein
MANSFVECLEIIRTNRNQKDRQDLARLEGYAMAAIREEEKELAKAAEGTTKDTTTASSDSAGEVVVRAYPWVKSRWLQRNADVIANINRQISHTSSGQCWVKTSTITKTNQDCYGVFTLKEVTQGSFLMFDDPAVCATSDPKDRCERCARLLPGYAIRLPCCFANAIYCSWRCANTANASYHGPLCGKSTVADMKENSESADDHANRGLWLRLLATIKQSMDANMVSSHPLDVPMINQLTTVFGITTRFSLKKHIIEPNECLQRIGVDIFRDFRYDTWVLRMLSARVDSNMRGHVFDEAQGSSLMLAVHRDYSFFNHSCEPNVDVSAGDGDQTAAIYLSATRKIRKGEELFISYLDEDQLELGYYERKKLLESWTGGRCECVRCAKERSWLDQDHASDDDFHPEDDE